MQKAIMKIIFEKISTKWRKIQLMVQRIITSRPLQQSNQSSWLIVISKFESWHWCWHWCWQWWRQSGHEDEWGHDDADSDEDNDGMVMNEDSHRIPASLVHGNRTHYSVGWVKVQYDDGDDHDHVGVWEWAHDVYDDNGNVKGVIMTIMMTIP